MEEGEYYHADLIGLACESRGGDPLGTVVAVENFGAGDILEIEKPDGRRTMVPFRAGVADLAEGRIVVDPAFSLGLDRPQRRDRPLSGQIVADRGRRDPAFAHGVADLVETQDDVAGGVEAGNAGALVVVDDDAAGVAG